MKKFLFPLITILLLAACSSSEYTINEIDSPKYKIDSSILVGDLKLQAYTFKGDYYIEAIDESGNKVFTIKDKAADYIHDFGFGEKREYPVKGCFLLSALDKNDYLYVLVSLYGDQVAHPHKFILKIKDGKIIKKEYFDTDDLLHGHFYPEKIAEWYGEYIIIYSTVRTSGHFIAVLDKDLNFVYGNPMDAIEWVRCIEKQDYLPFSLKNMVYTANSAIICVDISEYLYNKYLIWQIPITDEEIRVNKLTYSLDGNNIVADVDATTKAGEKKKYYLILNKDTGELVNP